MYQQRARVTQYFWFMVVPLLLLGFISARGEYLYCAAWQLCMWTLVKRLVVTYVTAYCAKERYSTSTSRPLFSSFRNSLTHLKRDEYKFKSVRRRQSGKNRLLHWGQFYQVEHQLYNRTKNIYQCGDLFMHMLLLWQHKYLNLKENI